MKKKGKKLLTIILALVVVLTTAVGTVPSYADGTATASTGEPYLAFRWSNYNESTGVHSEDKSKELVTSWGANQGTSAMFFYYVDADGSESLITDVDELSVGDDYVLNITPDTTVSGLMHVELANTGVSDIYYTLDETAKPVTFSVNASYNLFAQYHGDGFVFSGSSFSVVPQVEYSYLNEYQNIEQRTLDASEYTIRASLSDSDNGQVTATVTSDNEVVINIDNTATIGQGYNVTLTASVGGVDVAIDQFGFHVTDQYYALDSTVDANIKKGETISLDQFKLVQYSAANGISTVSGATYKFEDYNTNVWSISTDKQTLTRISNDGGYFAVGAYLVDDNNDSYMVTSKHYNCNSIHAHTRIVHNNGNNLYDNADLECMIEIDTSVDVSDIRVEFEMGTGDIWQDDNGLHNEFTAFNMQTDLFTVTTDVNTGLPSMITIHGNKVKDLRESGEFDSDFVSVKVTTYIGTEVFQLDSSGFNYFSTEPSYMGFDYEEMLTTESRTFGNTIEYHDYMGTIHTQQIISMKATGGDTDAVSIKYMDSTVDPNITDPFWEVTGVKAGIAEITITHENPDDTTIPMTHTFTVDVADERYHIWVNSEGSDIMFPTAQKTLRTEMNHEYMDDNGNNCGEPVDSYTAQVVSTSSNEVTATIDAQGVLTITSNNAPENHYTIEIAGYVNGAVVATTTYDLWIRKTYYELTPYAVENVLLGETLKKSSFTLNYYDADNTSSPVTDVTEDATLTFEYDPNVWDEDANTGNLTRKDIYDTEVMVSASINGDELARHHYHFGELRANAYIFFGENDSIIVKGIDASFPVNVNSSVDMSKVTVTAQIGTGEGDNFVPYTDQSGCTITQDANDGWFIRFNTNAIEALYNAGELENDSFVVKTTAYIGKAECESNYVRLWYQNSAFTYYCESGVIEDCKGLVSMNTKIPEEITCCDYTGAENQVTVTNVVSDSSAVTVTKTTNQENGTFWALYLNEKGVANITITHVDPADPTQTVDYTIVINVVTDQIGHGHRMLSGNEKFVFPGDVVTRELIVYWDHYDAATGEIITTDISDKATFNWFYESDVNSFDGTCNNTNIGTIKVSSDAGLNEWLRYGCDITYEVDGEPLYTEFRDTMYTTDAYPVVTASAFPSDYGFGDVATITPDIYLRTFDYTTGTEGKDAIPSDVSVYLEWYTWIGDNDITLYCNGKEISYVDRILYDSDDVYTAKRNAVWAAFDTSIWVEVYAQSFDDNNNECYEELGRYVWSLNATTCPHPSDELVVMGDVKETCTEDGYTGNTYCTVCDEMVKAGTTIEATGHTEVTDAAKAATCTTTGLTAGSHCSVCGEIITAQEVVAKKAHSYSANWTVDKTATTSAAGSKSHHCTVCGAKGSVTAIPKIKSVTLSSAAFTYNGKIQKPSVTVKDNNGATISSNYYTVKYADGCKNVGTYKVTVTFKGNYSGTASKTFTIKAQSLSASKVTLSKTSYTYDGKAKTPSVTVKNAAGTKLTKGTDYTVTYASGRKKPGTYKVTIKGKGKYTGTITKTFTVKVKNTSIKSLTAGSKNFTAKWSKQSSKYISGYQIRYSVKSDMSNAKKTSRISRTTTSKKISGLKAKKKYYVQIRTYKKIGSKYYYSSWSKVKKIKTK